MDQQDILQTTINEDAACVASEEVDGCLSASNARVSSSGHSRNSQKPKAITKHYGRRMKLNCRHGYNILIFPDGTVSTSDDDVDNHCILEFTSMLPGHVRIKGVHANLFLAMDKNGMLYGEPDPTNNSTIFIEQPEGPYSAYLSLKYRRKKWYVAIKKNGKIKLGPDTKRGQHATHFLTVLV